MVMHRWTMLPGYMVTWHVEYGSDHDGDEETDETNIGRREKEHAVTVRR